MTTPNVQEVLKAFLATMATTEDASWVLYVIAFLQISVAAFHLKTGLRHQPISTILLVVSSLLVPLLLIVGFYYAMQPVA
ncbi:hypothetical protein [Herbaspirillum rubrisubalbicans]|uniref:hypothetical protein n=1 Tax=Herbaspirillum rubrisubalbicans TaxID=80842 RepID=UPI0011BE9337|nr:hypothetical protein [Herbaspirillum rubrisubalbicans]